MELNENFRKSLTLAQNTYLITDASYKKLLENCFSVLSGRTEVHNMNSLYNSKPDIIKEFYAALLSVSARFVRNSLNKEEILQYLQNDCSFSPHRANIYIEFYERDKQDVEISLLNIGNCLPHVTDVKWKIDYIVKSNTMDESEGPLFRISLLAEEYEAETEGKKLKTVNFTCTSQELQDLVYKLKDAVGLCNFSQRIL